MNESEKIRWKIQELVKAVGLVLNFQFLKLLQTEAECRNLMNTAQTGFSLILSSGFPYKPDKFHCKKRTIPSTSFSLYTKDPSKLRRYPKEHIILGVEKVVFGLISREKLVQLIWSIYAPL